MEDLAAFTALPIARCFEPVENCEPRACAAPATWRRMDGPTRIIGYYCDQHHQSGDEPIITPELVRRVSVTAQILFSGTSFHPSAAQLEAVARLERAVESIGGLLSLHAVTSAVGRHRAPAAGAGDGEAGGRGESTPPKH